jgi:hypothetical protein
MTSRAITHLVVPLDEYAVVSHRATLREAMATLARVQETTGNDRKPPQAVLVRDDNGRVIGKVGQLAFLKALQAGYRRPRQFEELHRAGVSSEQISSIIEHSKFLHDSFDDLCLHARSIPVTDAMDPVTESVEETALLSAALQKIVARQMLSILVARQGEVVGLLRAVDLVDEALRVMTEEDAAEAGREQE